MSISLDKLKALRKQAGHVDKAALAPSSALVVDAAASPASASSATTWDARDSSQPDSVATSADAAVVDASPPSAAENATISPIADVATPPLLAHGDTAARAQQPPPAPRETSVFGWVEQIQHKAVAAPRALPQLPRGQLCAGRRMATCCGACSPPASGLPALRCAPNLRAPLIANCPAARSRPACI
jgi:hypothetical protein